MYAELSFTVYSIVESQKGTSKWVYTSRHFVAADIHHFTSHKATVRE